MRKMSARRLRGEPVRRNRDRQPCKCLPVCEARNAGPGLGRPHITDAEDRLGRGDSQRDHPAAK